MEIDTVNENQDSKKRSLADSNEVKNTKLKSNYSHFPQKLQEQISPIYYPELLFVRLPADLRWLLREYIIHQPVKSYQYKESKSVEIEGKTFPSISHDKKMYTLCYNNVVTLFYSDKDYQERCSEYVFPSNHDINLFHCLTKDNFIFCLILIWGPYYSIKECFIASLKINDDHSISLVNKHRINYYFPLWQHYQNCQNNNCIICNRSEAEQINTWNHLDTCILQSCDTCNKIESLFPNVYTGHIYKCRAKDCNLDNCDLCAMIQLKNDLDFVDEWGDDFMFQADKYIFIGYRYYYFYVNYDDLGNIVQVNGAYNYGEDYYKHPKVITSNYQLSEISYNDISKHTSNGIVFHYASHLNHANQDKYSKVHLVKNNTPHIEFGLVTDNDSDIVLHPKVFPNGTIAIHSFSLSNGRLCDNLFLCSPSNSGYIIKHCRNSCMAPELDIEYNLTLIDEDDKLTFQSQGIPFKNLSSNQSESPLSNFVISKHNHLGNINILIGFTIETNLRHINNVQRYYSERFVNGKFICGNQLSNGNVLFHKPHLIQKYILLIPTSNGYDLNAFDYGNHDDSPLMQIIHPSRYLITFSEIWDEQNELDDSDFYRDPYERQINIYEPIFY